MPKDYKIPLVKQVGDKLVLDDPYALGVIRTIAKNNCQNTLTQHYDRALHFRERRRELGHNPEDVVTVIVNVDDANGELLAEVLMPGANWQEVRDRGETPFARGLAERAGIIKALGIFDSEAKVKLEQLDGDAIVVVDFGVAEVYSYAD